MTIKKQLCFIPPFSNFINFIYSALVHFLVDIYKRMKSCNRTCTCAVLKLFIIQTFWIFLSQFLICSTEKLRSNFFSRIVWCDALVRLCLQSKWRNLFCKSDESSSPTRHDFSFLLFVFLLLSFSSFATPR